MALSSLHVGGPKPRVAVFVDGDNVPKSSLPKIEAEAARCGEVTVRRVFGDITLHKDWAVETTYVITHCATSAGKNRADMSLVVAAMDVAHRGMASAFVIVSDDRDFGPLVSHLREQGHRVEWIGKIRPAAGKPAASITSSPVLLSVDEKLRELISSHADAKIGVPLVTLGHLMMGAKVKEQTGKATWRAHLKERPHLFTVVGTGPSSCVRLTDQPLAP